jgi:iron complex outermembrane receptor protein
MKKITALFLALISFFSVQAQTGHTLSVTITDSQAQPVQGATVNFLNTNYIFTSGKSGEFHFVNLPAGKYILHISDVLFAEVNKEITVLDQDQSLIIRLSENNKQLDEVVVTAQKREEEVQNVPVSISTLSGKQIQDYQVWNLKDITAIVPNLYSANPGDNRNVTGIRGISTTSYDPAITTYIDEVSQFSLDTYIPQLFDIECAEVLRGPQGTLYGRNAMGGVINVVTRQPTNQLAGFAEANFGSYGQQRYSIGVTGPLIKDKLFFGIAGLYNGFSGFYTTCLMIPNSINSMLFWVTTI